MSSLTKTNHNFNSDLLNVEVEVYQDSDCNFWFHGATLCDIFGFHNSTQDIQRHVDEDWRKKFPFRGREAWYLSEPGLYQLVHASKNPAAKRFQRWVYGEVLPKLRQSGAYVMPTATQEQLFNHVNSVITQLTDSFLGELRETKRIAADTRSAQATEYNQLRQEYQALKSKQVKELNYPHHVARIDCFSDKQRMLHDLEDLCEQFETKAIALQQRMAWMAQYEARTQTYADYQVAQMQGGQARLPPSLNGLQLARRRELTHPSTQPRLG